MNQEDTLDKLKESLQICDIHYQRLSYALMKVKPLFPLTQGKYQNLTFDDLSYIDQLIFRFSKLQDSMGTRLFPAILENLGEDVSDKPFIDLLTRMEKLNLIDNHKQWLALREIRNEVTHEYPFFTPEIIDGLNSLIEHTETIIKILENMRTVVNQRFL